MKHLLLLFSISLLFACGGTKNTGEKECDFALRYTSSEEKILIEDGRISRTRTEYAFGSPQSGTPTDSRVYEMKKREKLSKEDLKRLKDMVTDPNFKLLQEGYGAPENERNYPYAIEVRNDCENQVVVFRSNPSYPKAPPLFIEAEKLIMELAIK